MSDFKPSKYQQKIFSWVNQGKGNAIIEAVAGSGKTTTIIGASKLVPKDDKSIFVAFNKSIATELQKRLPKNVEAKTLHSFGYGLFYTNTNIKIKLDNYKLFNIISEVLGSNGYDDSSFEFKEKLMFLRKLIPFLKAFNTNYTDFGEVNEILLYKNFEEELDDKTFSIIKTIMDKCKENVEVIDFDDMIWLPVVNDFKSKTYDWVFVDECQDLTVTQLELIKKMCGSKTRVIGVGDRYQAIYSFRGADSNSMHNFKTYFEAESLPLSICYRCPKLHIELAKTLVPHIESFDKNEDGIVEYIDISNGVDKMVTGDLVLCRTNAPLIKVAFMLIRLGKKAVVRGRDIGKGLLKIVNQYKVSSLAELESRIYDYKNLQEKKLDLIEQGKFDKRKKNNLLSIIDSCDTIMVLLENVETIDELKEKIETIFSDEIEGIVCSSVHKAKGLEADNTFIINYDNMPHPMAQTEDEIEQENNIKYVALTRGKKSMSIIGDIGK